ncbi:MAG: hypothetical protein J5J00_06050 [Deltaproteobacteria bacterium]|nr:hypothetical protein [Deltaproteobacteria bacterium]
MRTTVDFAIVGGSVAGSSMARILSSLGLTVAIVDKGLFPRRKACGEGISAKGVKILQEIGFRPVLNRLPHTRLRGYQLQLKDKKISIPSSLIGVQRFYLDKALLDCALSSPRVLPFLGTAAAKIDGSGPFQVTLSDNTVIESRWLAVASGARPLTVSGTAINPRFGVSSIWECEQDTGNMPFIQIFAGQNYQVFLTPVGPHTFNAALLSTKNSGHALTNKSASVELMGEAFARAGIQAQAASYLVGKTCLQAQSARAFHNNIFMLGDACEQFDPVGGMGMTHALLSSRILGEEMRLLIDGRMTLAQTGVKYTAKREAAARPLRGFTFTSYLALVRAQEQLARIPSLYRTAGTFLSGGLGSTHTVRNRMAHTALSFIGACL